MAKKPTPKDPAKPFSPGVAAPGRFSPTVGLPASAIGKGPVKPAITVPGGNSLGGFKPGVGPSRAPASPADITRLLQLGGGHLAAGRLDHAGKAAAAVLGFQPKNPDGLHLLGLVALGKGEPATAEKLIAAAAAVMPKHVNVWVNLGNAQRDQGKTDEAVLSYHHAEMLKPDYPDVFLNRGQLYQETSQFAEAIADFERLIELQPDQATSYLRAASAAADAGKFREAIAYCEEAIDRLDVVPLQIETILATTHERLGNLDEAIARAESILVRKPENAGALRTWSKARRRKIRHDPELLAELRHRLEKANPGKMKSSDARLVYSELAQICDEQGDTEQAFSYFVLLNDRTSQLPSLKNVDRTKFIDDLDQLLGVFTSKFVSEWRSLPEIEIEPGHASVPVFLVGFPRSGTTLLDQILDAHPGVQVFEEMPLLSKVKKVASSSGYPLSLGTMTKEQRTGLRQVYWNALKDAGADLEGKLVINKMPLDIAHAGLVSRVFPEARFIFASRHPADCVLSCFMQDFVPNASMLNFLTLEGSAQLYDRVMT
ncbi:MAG: sulfotransferase, partial [Parvibaculum sp.]